MKYWKKIKDGSEIKLLYVDGDEIDYLIDRISELHIRKELVDEDFYKKQMLELIERLRKEIESDE